METIKVNSWGDWYKNINNGRYYDRLLMPEVGKTPQFDEKYINERIQQVVKLLNENGLTIAYYFEPSDMYETTDERLVADMLENFYRDIRVNDEGFAIYSVDDGDSLARVGACGDIDGILREICTTQNVKSIKSMIETEIDRQASETSLTEKNNSIFTRFMNAIKSIIAKMAPKNNTTVEGKEQQPTEGKTTETSRRDFKNGIEVNLKTPNTSVTKPTETHQDPNRSEKNYDDEEPDL